MGWLVWRDAPTLPIILGNAIIIGSGLFVATRGRRARRRSKVDARSLCPSQTPPALPIDRASRQCKEGRGKIREAR